MTPAPTRTARDTAGIDNVCRYGSRKSARERRALLIKIAGPPMGAARSGTTVRSDYRSRDWRSTHR